MKNTEYTKRLDSSLAPLLKQMIQGAEEIGLAAIGPATSRGSLIFDSAAAFFSSRREVEIKGAESVFKGKSSMMDEQPATARQDSIASNLIRSSISREGDSPYRVWQEKFTAFGHQLVDKQQNYF